MFTQTSGIEISLKVGLSKIDKEISCGQASLSDGSLGIGTAKLVVLEKLKLGNLDSIYSEVYKIEGTISPSDRIRKWLTSSKPSGNFMYHPVLLSKTLYGSHVVFICCVRTSEQRANFSLYNISSLVMYNRGGDCLLRCTH